MFGRSLLTCGDHGEVQLHVGGSFSVGTLAAAVPAILCSQRAQLQEHCLVLHHHLELGATFRVRAASRSEGQAAAPPLGVDPADCHYDGVTGLVSANWTHIRLMMKDLMEPFSRTCRRGTAFRRQTHSSLRCLRIQRSKSGTNLQRWREEAAESKVCMFPSSRSLSACEQT